MPLNDRQKVLLHRLNRLIGTIIFGFLLTVFAIEFNFMFLFGTTPDPETINNPDLNLASEIWSADSVVIGKFYLQNRSPVTYEEVNPWLYKALISTEDIRFFEHFGIDVKSTFAVIYYTLKGDRRGGSTITQQLAKNMFNTRDKSNLGLLNSVPLSRTVVYKLKEWITSLRLEARYEKDEILVMYLNTVDFGSNAFGIKVAAKTYFDTTPDSLSIEEAATLVGLLKAPSYYNPVRYPDHARQRRNVVIQQMVKYNQLTRQHGDSLRALPLITKFSFETHDEGLATYFRNFIMIELRDWAIENGYNLFTDGLHIHTTIHSRMQYHAEMATKEKMKQYQQAFAQHWGKNNPWINENGLEISDYPEQAIQKLPIFLRLVDQFGGNSDSVSYHLNRPKKMTVFTYEGLKDTTLSTLDSLLYYKKFLHSGLVAIDPYDGSIRAWVGGTDYRFFKYDHVMQAKRQSGSTFKPIVYTAAIEHGLAPCDTRMDTMLTMKLAGGFWTPKNATNSYSNARYTLRQAMARSINTITVRLTQEVGPAKVAEMAKKLGIESDLEEVYSIGLGSNEVSLLELASTYAPMINGGYRVKPRYLNRIEDKDGNVLESFPVKKVQVISEETSFLMTEMLKGGVEESGGTARGLYAFDLFRGNQVGGKTGTTSNYSDGWFVAVTPQLVAASWVGGEEPVIRFRGSQGEGARTALPIVGEFLQDGYLDSKTGLVRQAFKRPNITITKPYNCRLETFLADSSAKQNVRQLEQSIQKILEGLRNKRIQ